MRVTVHYMAQLRRAAGVSEETIAVAEGCTVGGLLEHLAARKEAVRAVVLGPGGQAQKSLLVFVNDEQVRAGQELQEGDAVTLLTPMAGG